MSATIVRTIAEVRHENRIFGRITEIVENVGTGTERAEYRYSVTTGANSTTGWRPTAEEADQRIAEQVAEWSSLMSLETPTAAGTEARTPAWIARRPAVAKDIIWGIVDHPDPEAVRAAYLAQLAHDRDAVARRLRELRATHGWGDARTTGPELELSSLRAEIRRFS